jgi:hypothetical protein
MSTTQISKPTPVASKATVGGARAEILTIEDAINAYRGSSAEAEGYRSLITLLIDAGFSQPFKNDSYYDALVLTEAMLNRSNHRIKLLTGPACDGFYSALSVHFMNALQRIHNAGGEVKMIILGTCFPPALGELVKKFPGTFQIALAKPLTKLRHFIVCDSKIVRVEEYHEELSANSGAHEIKADVNFNNPSQGKMLETYFDSIWSAVSPVKK